ncbi:MAG: dihydrolipoyl dehydrogenase [Alphaproteobacteria bacterium]|nr:dihydrolipoyl dehydrogenase [Alphaproteobacteria bacterium]
MTETYSLIVIGAGPGGYVAAIRAAQLGIKTAIVESENLGGICLNWGCIPAKALLRSAEVYRQMKHAADYGLSCAVPGFDLEKIVARSRGISKQLNAGVEHLLKKNKVPVISGWAKLAGKSGKHRKIVVETAEKKTQTLLTEKVLIASGARARQLPDMETDGTRIWSYRDALTPKFLPKNLLVIGSGAIGIEFASFFNTLGTKTTVVEALKRILPSEDAEISAVAQKSFEQQGMTIHTAAKLLRLRASKNSVTANLELQGKTQQQEFDAVIMAVGIVGNTENLGLENTKVRIKRNHIETDAFGATAEPDLYAIGDVTGAPWLAHKAEHEGVVCVEKIAGVADVHPIDKSNIPGCIYCHPQLASVGLTEAKAKDAGLKVKVGRFPFSANGKAIALGETEGMIKTVFDAKTGALLGTHMIGAEVTELIQGYTLARTLETTETELMRNIFPHPTLSEVMHESALSAYDRAIHI